MKGLKKVVTIYPIEVQEKNINHGGTEVTERIHCKMQN